MLHVTACRPAPAGLYYTDYTDQAPGKFWWLDTNVYRPQSRWLFTGWGGGGGGRFYDVISCAWSIVSSRGNLPPGRVLGRPPPSHKSWQYLLYWNVFNLSTNISAIILYLDCNGQFDWSRDMVIQMIYHCTEWYISCAADIPLATVVYHTLRKVQKILLKVAEFPKLSSNTVVCLSSLLFVCI